MSKMRIEIPSDALGQRLDQRIGNHTELTRSAFKQYVDKKGRSETKFSFFYVSSEVWKEKRKG